MNKNSTQSFKQIRPTSCETSKNLSQKIKFLQDYHRAFVCVATKTSGKFAVFLN